MLGWLGAFFQELFGVRSAQAAVYSQPVDPRTVPFTFPTVANVAGWQNAAREMDRLYFGGWFQNRGLIPLIAAMVMTESSGGKFRVRMVSLRDTSYGPMHVTPYTAKDIYNRGYKLFTPDPLTLMGTKGGLYYGMAYVKILWEVYGRTTPETLAKSYNGGPGYNSFSAKGKNQVQNHWNKVRSYLA